MENSRSINSIPKHARISADLRDRIWSGRYSVGSTLPSRRHLATEYGVAVGTVQTALTLLIQDGTLRPRGRWGTMVAHRKRPGENPSPDREYASSIKTAESGDLEAVSRLVRPVARPASESIVGVIMFYADRVFQGPWRQDALSPIERAASSVGSTVLYAEQNSTDDPRRIIDICSSLKSQGASGFIFVTHGEMDLFDSILDFIRVNHDPIVWIGISPAPRPLMSVYYNNVDAGFHAADHLLSRGCRSLLFYSPCEAEWVSKRAAGAAERFSLSRSADCDFEQIVDPLPQEELGDEPDFFRQAAAKRGRELFTNGCRWDAIIAANDLTAVGLIEAASEYGLEPPRDFLIVGYDDLPIARKIGLSTIRPPMENIGQNAVKLIMNAWHGDHSRSRVCLNSDLIIRKSTLRVLHE